MKQVLFEEDGAFRVGTILSEAGASFQVEAAHGKRSKVKAASILLRFDGQALGAFMPEAQKLALPLDPKFLWEVSGREEFGFDELAREYFGRAPTPQESAAVALALHANPMYFYRRGKGRYQAAPEESLRAALAGAEKKRRAQEQVDAWAGDLAAGRVPPPIAEKLDVLLFKPDKMALEWRALDAAAHAAGATPQRVLALAGALAGPEDFFLRRFAFELFPRGTGFEAMPGLDEPAGLSESNTAAFSIDDEETTEIDDAFSMATLDDGSLRVGVHRRARRVFLARMHWRRWRANGFRPSISPAGRSPCCRRTRWTARHSPRAAASRPRPCTSPSIPRASRCSATNRASSGSAWRTTCAWATWTGA